MSQPRSGTSAGLAICIALTLLLVACGGDDSDSDNAPSPTPTVMPLSFDAAFLAHLSDGLGDIALADDLVTALGERTLNALDQATDGDVGDPLLALSPPSIPTERIDSIVVFAFGNRVDAEGNIAPGPMNEALARTTAGLVSTYAVPVYAQWEVAGLLIESGVPGVVSIGTTVDENGEIVYLSTAGVAEQAVDVAEHDGVELGQVGVIAFADHAVRSVLTARAAGMTAFAPEGLALPSEYDPDSGQPWTRDRLTYLAVDLPARLLLADR